MPTRAAQRALPRAGSRMLMSSAMIAITTSSSMSVNPGWCFVRPRPGPARADIPTSVLRVIVRLRCCSTIGTLVGPGGLAECLGLDIPDRCPHPTTARPDGGGRILGFFFGAPGDECHGERGRDGALHQTAPSAFRRA